MRTIVIVLPALLWAAPVLAQDPPAQDAAQSDDLQKLLNSIPNIETKAPPPAEKPPEEQEGVDLFTYTADVRKAVLSHWAPAAKLIEKNPRLTCQLLVKINEDGTLGDALVSQSSGNKKFDESAAAAVLATPGVMAPPVSLRGTVAQGVLVNFVAAAAPTAAK